MKQSHQKLQVLAQNTILKSFHEANMTCARSILAKAFIHAEETTPEDVLEPALVCLRVLGVFLAAGMPVVQQL